MIPKTLLALMAVASLTLQSYGAQNLSPAQTQFTWDKWDVKIDTVQFQDSIQESRTEKRPDSDSEFVYLKLTVKNADNHGKDFIPQNNLKVVIGENEFDSADIDPNYEYTKNIEPTLVRNRECYFELPKALVKDSFTLRFQGGWTDTADILVTISTQESISTPTPASTPSPTPEVTQPVTPQIREPEPVVQKDSIFIRQVWEHYSNYDTGFFSRFVQDGLVNWFGRHGAHLNWILNDMSQDARRYSQWSVTYHLETFWREVSKEYSSNWEGAMIYDHIEMVSRVYENGNRWHVAHVRFTVKYTNVNAQLKIYAMIYKVF